MSTSWLTGETVCAPGWDEHAYYNPVVTRVESVGLADLQVNDER
jgi:hypothetical protein